MAPSMRPVADPVAAYLAARDGQSVDPVTAYLSGGAPVAPAPGNAALHADYQSGALARRTAATNASEADDAKGPGYVSRFVTHLLNTAQGIPGMEAVEAGAGALGSHLTDHPLSYRQSLNTLRDATGNLGGLTSAAEKTMGSLAVLPFLPASPTTAGAVLGGADQALSADPDQSILERTGRTAIGAGAGAITGRFLDHLITAGRARISPSSATVALRREAERGTAASRQYARALAEGQGKTDIPAIHAVLGRPDVAEIVSGLRQTDQFANAPAHAPEMLDAIYKTLSDQASTAKRGLDALTPNKPNIGRYRLKEIKSSQEALLDAMGKASMKPPIMYDVPAAMTGKAARITPEREPLAGPIPRGLLNETTTAPGDPTLRQALRDFPHSSLPPEMQGPAGPAFQLGRRPQQVVPGVQIETPAMRVQTAPAQSVPAPMPSYPAAVRGYAEASKLLDAVKRGSDQIRGAGIPLKSGKNLTKTSIEAFQAWAAKASPEELAAAQEGLLGGLHDQGATTLAKILGIPILPVPTRAGALAPGLLRTVNPASGNLAKGGLLTLHGSY